MSFLLDTNVISEWVKPQPHAGVIRWLSEADEDTVFISVISIAEISRGLEKMISGKHRERIAAWLQNDLLIRFEGRVLPVDISIALQWGVTSESARRKGIAPGAMDALIAATAAVHDMTMVTRNIRDFARLRISVFDPWTENYFESDTSA